MEGTSISLEIRWRLNKLVTCRKALPGPGDAEETWDEMGSQRVNIVAQIIPDEPSCLCLRFERCLYVSLYLFGELGNGKRGL